MKRHALLILAGLLFSAAALRDGADRWVARTDLPPVLSETSTEVRGRRGQLLRAFTVEDGLWRFAVRPDQVDPRYLRMLIRYEDKRFWQHSGVDLRALLRAAAQSVVHGRPVSGGSTLTMQVARLLENSGTGSWAGKLRQIRVALALERRHRKADILALYLTHAPYGGNLEGIRAATLAWFGKEPARLTPAEAALLVALPQSPEGRRPDRHAARSLAARNRVLQRMASQQVLLPADAAAAMTDPLPQRMHRFPGLAAHLAEAVVAADPAQMRHDLSIDAGLQAALEALARSISARAGERLSAAIVVADHGTGETLAAVGSAGYGEAEGRQGFVDMTRAVRSPGSTLKPLIYGLAFDQGLVHPETLIHDGPAMFGRYAPQNFDGLYRGDIRVRDALQLSLNVPVVKLSQELGPERIMAALKRAGTDPQLPGDAAAGLAVALGGVGMSLRDLVQLYAVLAQGGEGPVLRVRMADSLRHTQRVLSDVAAWQVGHILVGLPPPPGAPPGLVAYKTGTSYGHRDAWAIGFDGRHVIGVWMGRADGTPVPGAFGGDLAAPALFEAFGRVKPGFDPLPAPPPATLLLGTADLPEPLRRFQPRRAVFEQPPDAPRLTFPPDGSRLQPAGETLTIKLRSGAAPFHVLVDGRPVASGLRAREFEVARPGRGFSTLVVIDANGRSDRVTVELP